MSQMFIYPSCEMLTQEPSDMAELRAFHSALKCPRFGHAPWKAQMFAKRIAIHLRQQVWELEHPEVPR